MLLAAGFLYGYDNVTDPTCKREHYRLVQALANAFKDRFGSIVCRDILGKQAGADSPEPRPAPRNSMQHAPASAASARRLRYWMLILRRIRCRAIPREINESSLYLM